MINGRRGVRLGLGPVFAYEWIALSRRWQWYALRSLFAGSLLAALVVMFWRPAVPADYTTIRNLARMGESFYIAVIGTQLTLVLLAAPAATAGSICRDRASGTLTFMLVSDLSDTEIVLGKLASRLVPVLGLVACAMPLLALLTLLGGVDPDALFGAFLISIGIAVLGCSLALLFSVWASKTHEALLGTYAVWGIWLLAGPFLGLVNRAFSWSLSLPPRIADPYFLAFSPYWHPGSVTLVDDLWFLLITTGIGTVLTVVAVRRIRAVCTRDGAARKQSFWGRMAGISDRFATFIRRFDPTRFLATPSLDRNPVLWREWHRARPSRWSRVVGALYMSGAMLGSFIAIVPMHMTVTMAWVNGLQVSIGMLLLSVMAATSLAEERMRGSLDVLMTTTLSTNEIVLGKWLGTFRLVPRLVVLPVLVIACGDMSRRNYFPTVILTLVFVLVCGAAITGLGLLMATWCAQLGRAVALTVTIYVFMAVGWLFIAMMIMRNDGEGVLMGSPFYFAGLLAADFSMGNGGREHFDWAWTWIWIYALAAFVFLGATLAIFNRCLGRAEFGVSRFTRARLRVPLRLRRAGPRPS